MGEEPHTLPRHSKAKEQGLLTFPPQPLLWWGKRFVLINFCTFVTKEGRESSVWKPLSSPDPSLCTPVTSCPFSGCLYAPGQVMGFTDELGRNENHLQAPHTMWSSLRCPQKALAGSFYKFGLVKNKDLPWFSHITNLYPLLKLFSFVRHGCWWVLSPHSSLMYRAPQDHAHLPCPAPQSMGHPHCRC